MAIEHVNRRGDTYYLHEGKTKSGKATFFFSRKKDGTLPKAIPEGYEIHERPDKGQVFLRKAKPLLVTKEEIALVERGAREFAKLVPFLIDVQGKSITIHKAEQDEDCLERTAASFGASVLLVREAMAKGLTYSPALQFTLTNEETRGFVAQYWIACDEGGEWNFLGLGELPALVKEHCSDLGKGWHDELF